MREDPATGGRPGAPSADELPCGLLGPGRGLTFLVVAVLVCVYLGACFAYLVHTRSQGILLGYRLGRARQLQLERAEDHRQLQIEARVWRTPERLQSEATRTLGLQPVEGAQVLYLPEVQPVGTPGAAPAPAAPDSLALLPQRRGPQER